jgi:hypothetical protein
MKPIILAVLLVSLASPAAAQSRFDWKPYAAVIGGQTAALVTHERFFAQGCVGTNPLYTANPAVRAALVPAVIATVGVLALKVTASKSLATRRLTKAIVYGLGLAGGATAISMPKGCGR